jgi:quercetin dioxygenase-like cupin family protein
VTDGTESALRPWTRDFSRYPDVLKRLVFQHVEQARADALPHVVEQLPLQPGVQGMDSPHQTGDHISYDMLTRAPHYLMTSHFTRIMPGSPVRGMHRHLSAPALFCLGGRGWERNDDETYHFVEHDLLVVPPYTIHQHGGDDDVQCDIFVPETGRAHHVLGLTWREQMKLSEKPTFPQGTEPLYDGEDLIGYRIKKGVLGITEDLDVVLGNEPERSAMFAVRQRPPGSYEPVVTGEPTNTYDRYVSLLDEEVAVCHTADHVVRYAEEAWESTPQGRLKWLLHPRTATAANQRWIYLQQIPARSRSGRHRHLAEELVLVLRGSGYDIHDGRRWDWKQGDLICVPTMTDHQHFNLGDEPALLMSTTPAHYSVLGLGGIEQLECAPEYEEETDA